MMRVHLGQAILFCPSPVARRRNFAKHTRLCTKIALVQKALIVLARSKPVMMAAALTELVVNDLIVALK